MSLTATLNIATSGLLANQQALAATSENIANVNTENFSRRDVDFIADAVPGQFSGVRADVAREGANRFLQASAFDARSDDAASRAVADALARVEASLGAPGDNLSFANALADAFAAFATLAATPSSTAARADAVSRLDAAFASFNATLDAIDAESAQALAGLQDDVAATNALLEDLFALNRIAPESGGAGDQIDAGLAELADNLPIVVTRDETGRASVTTTTGLTLLDGNGFATLAADPGPPAAVTLGGADLSADLSGGAFGGAISLLNDRLPAVATIVSDAATAAADAINAAYAQNAAVGDGAPVSADLVVTADGRFGVDPGVVAAPETLAIARPETGLTAGANDGRGAAAIAELGAGAAGAAARDAVALSAADAGAAASDATRNEAFRSEIETRLLSDGGVNLDEELSNLILFQRSFGANARIITAVDELWQTLLAI
ncbi:MAG: flagellar hook-associated protein FlgK [Parvularculaceae bacterium]